MDTNMVRLIQAGNAAVLSYLVAIPADRIWLSSIAAEEILAGLLANINRARTRKPPFRLGEAHSDLAKNLEDLRWFSILAYSEEAETIFQDFSPASKRTGSQDCRIAAQALSENLVVVTRNLTDFETIGVACVDWSRSE
ncbi:MAG: hypothetical protein NTX57_03890 [Armatimonadetes bacterium]|nr:hypothetical protein [Armatimonadota bacterium]